MSLRFLSNFLTAVFKDFSSQFEHLFILRFLKCDDGWMGYLLTTSERDRNLIKILLLKAHFFAHFKISVDIGISAEKLVPGE